MRSASISVDDERIAGISHGLLVLVGVGASDKPEDGERLARRIVELRVFEDERGRLQHAIGEAGGAILAIPQFTLYGDLRRGRRPDFTHAAPAERGRALFDALCASLRLSGVAIETGRFGTHMRITMEADGPVTIVATTDGWEEARV